MGIQQCIVSNSHNTYKSSHSKVNENRIVKTTVKTRVKTTVKTTVQTIVKIK